MSNGPANTAENKPAQSSRTWEVLKISFPLVTALVTAIVGFFIWNAQNKIRDKVENNNLLIQAQLQTQHAQLQAQLALKEEFYKRRLTIYDEACRQIADAETSLADLGMSDESVIRATNLVDELYKFRKRHQLYWSKQLDGDLDKLWSLGICRVGSIPCETPEGKVLPVEDLPKEIASAVVVVHEQMKTDLNIFELAKALQEANKASQEAK